MKRETNLSDLPIVIEFIKSQNFSPNQFPEIYCPCNENFPFSARALYDEAGLSSIQKYLKGFLETHAGHGKCFIQVGEEKIELPTENESGLQEEFTEGKKVENIQSSPPIGEIESPLPSKEERSIETSETESDNQTEGANPQAEDEIEEEPFDEGWVKLHRKIIKNPIFKDSATLHLFLYLLLKANHEPNRFLFNKNEIRVNRGQLITGRRKISRDTNISEWKIRDRFRALENLDIITHKTTHRFTIITICNYEYYQETKNQKPPTELKNLIVFPPPTDHPLTATNKNDKKLNRMGRSKKKETDPRVSEFIKCWGETFKEETGKPYLINYGKDGDLVKKMFQAGHSLEDIQCYSKIAFKDDQCKRRGLTIGIFSQELNRLVGLREMNPLEQARREMRKGN
jgi:hypothetical protein